MGMIRQADAHMLAREAIVLDLGDLSRQAAALRQRAERDAARIAEEARRERERLIAGAAEQGHREGLERGLAEGRERGRAEGAAEASAEHAKALAELTAAWSAALDAFGAQRDRMLDEANRDLLRLSIEIARRIVRRTTAREPGVVADQLEELLAIVARPSRLAIRIHPGDAARAREALGPLLQRFTLCTHAELIEDPEASPGTCAATTDRGGEIDASIETRLARLTAALLGEAPA